MTQIRGLPPLEGELASLKARRDALRQAAGLPRAKLRPTLDAALAELDAAIDALTAAQDAGDGPGDDRSAEASQSERRLLRAVFQDAPVPLFLLERDGTVRRVNKAAGELLDTGTGYATGKPFTTFVNLTSRAAVHTQLASTIRTGRTTRVRCELLTSGGTADCELTAGMARPKGDADKIVVAVSRATGPTPAAGAAAEDDDVTGTAARGRGPRGAASADTGAGSTAPADISVMTRRLDLVTAITRLLLETEPHSEAVTVQRCAELIASELAAWVIVDVAHGDRLRRQFVVGPEDQRSAELAREVAGRDPQPGSVPHTVHDSRDSQLIAHVEDAGVLGEGPDGVPLLMLLGATSVLSVPLSDAERAYGALTLARQAEEGHFELADLGLLEELGEQLGLAIRKDRTTRRRTQITDALQASLLPPGLPSVPGVEVASAHLAAAHLTAENPEMGGDFYDLYRTGAGWGLSIGDVGGRGGDVAAVGAAARHAIRVVGHFNSDPSQVLTSANEVMLAEEFGGRFVTACIAHMEWRDRSLRVTVGCAGHPGPVLVRKDGQTHQMRGGGVPLGLFPDTELGIEEHDLQAGDALVLFTDGLTDARSQDLGRLGDRLTGEVTALAGRPPGLILARLRELALDFSGSQPRDDITMVALRVGEAPAGG
jgi:serine phosphatase RsbU (regulator of sigma subunit)/PAS domain-containing protein